MNLIKTLKSLFSPPSGAISDSPGAAENHGSALTLSPPEASNGAGPFFDRKDNWDGSNGWIDGVMILVAIIFFSR